VSRVTFIVVSPCQSVLAQGRLTAVGGTSSALIRGARDPRHRRSPSPAVAE
jgi:hypothetical protein